MERKRVQTCPNLPQHLKTTKDFSIYDLSPAGAAEMNNWVLDAPEVTSVGGGGGGSTRSRSIGCGCLKQNTWPPPPPFFAVKHPHPP